MKTAQSLNRSERVLLLGVAIKHGPRTPGGTATASARESLLELDALARSAGADVTGTILQVRDALDSATLVGKGKLEEIKTEARMRDTPLIIVDRNLTPAQQRNMEDSTDCRVIDRTQLILDIFARRAHTREGQLQVELAQLSYLLPRLSGRGTELSRLGGGIGTRGPGAQKLETDRRRIRDRMSKLRKGIETVRRQRATRREARRAVPIGTIALVGYTNAGKSTLFNVLTRSDVFVSPKMFATLDPTLRGLTLPSRRRVLLSDTVGFLRDLPPSLIAAFRATLEEVQEAALLLVVTDVSHPEHAEQDAEVEKILTELGVADRPRIHVMNKVDRLPPEEREMLLRVALTSADGPRKTAFVSAQTGEGLPELLASIDRELPEDRIVRVRLRIAQTDSRHLAMVYAAGHVLESVWADGHYAIVADLPQSLALRLSAHVDAADTSMAVKSSATTETAVH
jgi:GTP-binding protein HflX